MMKFKQWLLQEMPLSINMVGDWEGAKKRVKAGDLEKTSAERYTIPKNLITSQPERHPVGGINRWPASTIGLLTNPVAKDKIVKRFQSVPEDFVANMVITPLAHQFTGVTDQKEVSEKQLRSSLQITPEEAPVYPDKINLFFVRNDGGDLMDLGAWTIAHRFGHMLDSQDYSANTKSALRKMYDHFEKKIFSILEESYAHKTSRHELSYLFLANELLTMKSARDKRIKSDNDIAGELTAQYIMQRRIKLNNKLPDKIPVQTNNWMEKVPKISYLDRKTPAIIDLTEWETYMELVIQRILDSAKGKIYVM